VAQGRAGIRAAAAIDRPQHKSEASLLQNRPREGTGSSAGVIRRPRSSAGGYRIVTGAGSGATVAGWVPGRLAVSGGCGTGAAFDIGG